MKWVKLLSWSGEQYGLLERKSEFIIKLWGIIKFDITTGKYLVAAYSPERVLQTVLETVDTLEEAQTAIEKYLFDTGTLKEGDEVEYENYQSE